MSKALSAVVTSIILFAMALVAVGCLGYIAHWLYVAAEFGWDQIPV